VLKPVDNRGARGVIRINKNSDVDKAFNYSMNFSSSKKLILEKWLSGYQLSTEALVISGKTYLCGVADRNYSNLKNTFPYVIEDGGETPSKFYPKIKNELQKIMDVVAKAFEIKNGVLKGDIILKNNRLYIIEIATRLSGGFWSTMSIPLVYRINLIEKAILLALGLKTKPPPKQLRHYCYEVNRYIFPNPGIIKNITKPPREKIPKYVTYLEVNAKVGDRVDAIINHPMRKGRIQVIGKTRNQCIKRVTKIRNLIKIKTN
jgi:biotin carboxylase